MDAKALDLEQWNELCILYGNIKDESKEELPKSFALRCENTHLIVGWESGGFTFCGHTYTSFRPLHKGEIAMLAVRDDFLKWVKSRKIKASEIARQPELF